MRSAEQILLCAPLCVREIKRDDHKEGFDAFLQNRKPVWTDR